MGERDKGGKVLRLRVREREEKRSEVRFAHIASFSLFKVTP